ncbi:5'-nucleotidase C-terminal domain-containing protein [Phocaeicola sp. HCN-40430]|uniref:bifunctional metallophosphatase/5'-nucleotidase n=2 Tax=Phocaeicola sp. HCN-40430 TaxID=3134664 RepID=UPI0030BCCE3A
MKIKNCFVCMMAFLGIGYTPVSASSEKEVTLKLIETSDVHGCYYPYDFIRRHSVQGSLARVSALVGEMRKTYGDRLILMDNGDILQGQPVAYYYNYIDTTSVHVVADMLNYMHYDVATMGNHDIEAGHAVYDRWVSQCKFPVLGANIMDVKTGKTYLPPYKVIEREGVKVVVLGMITPAIPSWLPEQLWSGLRFEDMETSARKWVKWIQEKEKPDVLIGLFHAGPEGNKLDNVVENGSGDVARRVPGFDVVFMGHDHVRTCQKIINEAGDSVLLVDPANMAKVVADVTVKVVKKDGKVIRKSVEGKLASVDRYTPDEAFLKTFEKQYQATADFVSRKIGRINKTITTKDAYFGPSAFIDLIHQLQLDITGADVSFCAPLSFAAEIKEGDIYVSDMFNLYKYENMLYTMMLTGKEIKDFLEMSYAIWTNQMKSPDDHLMLLNEKDKGFGRFKNPSFNFDSAAGILYTVDVTKPQGEKINIRSMADGTPFRMDKMYKVAVNSYRGNGGGDLLTKGAGIPKQDLAKRIVFATEKDLRYYLMKRIEEVKILDPRPLNQWKFIPEKWVEPAAKRDYRLLFGEDR